VFSFPIQNGLKHGDVITTGFQLCCKILHLEGPEKPNWNETNGTHQLVSHADDVNLLEYNVDTIQKNTETLSGLNSGNA
jgi:hypothetical protein